MILALLGWTKLPQWAMELLFTAIVIAVVASGIMYWHHKVLDEGIAKQVAADNAASQIVIKNAAAQTAAAQTKADTAEQAHAKETADLQAQLDALHNTPPAPIRLCLAHGSGGSVPQTGTPDAKHASAGSPSRPIQQMPTGDSGGGEGTAGPDIADLLSLFALQADAVSAELREYQSL
jgi:hypothetical protein